MNRRLFLTTFGALLLSWWTAFACHDGGKGGEGNGGGNDSGSDSGDSGSDSGGDSGGASTGPASGGPDRGRDNDANGDPCDEIDRGGWPGDPYRRPCRRPKLKPIW